MIILASFQQHPLIAFAAATTLMIGAGYSLWLAKRVIWGDVGNAHVAQLKDLNMREWIVIGGFAAGVLLIGVRPKPLTDLMEPSIAQQAARHADSKIRRHACGTARLDTAGPDTTTLPITDTRHRGGAQLVG